MSDLPCRCRPAGAAELELPLASLAAGEYLIELNAKARPARAGADRVQECRESATSDRLSG